MAELSRMPYRITNGPIRRIPVNISTNVDYHNVKLILMTLFHSYFTMAAN